MKGGGEGFPTRTGPKMTTRRASELTRRAGLFSGTGTVPPIQGQIESGFASVPVRLKGVLMLRLHPSGEQSPAQYLGVLTPDQPVPEQAIRVLLER
jgi:hypothetical protein